MIHWDASGQTFTSLEAIRLLHAKANANLFSKNAFWYPIGCTWHISFQCSGVKMQVSGLQQCVHCEDVAVMYVERWFTLSFAINFLASRCHLPFARKSKASNDVAQDISAIWNNQDIARQNIFLYTCEQSWQFWAEERVSAYICCSKRQTMLEDQLANSKQACPSRKIFEQQICLVKFGHMPRHNM